jgi:ABC-type sugar transport system permease subunit
VSSTTLSPPAPARPRMAVFRYVSANKVPLAFIAPALVVMLAVMLYPLVSAFVLSGERWDGIRPRSWIGFQNYRSLWSDDSFHNALWHTAYFTIATTVLLTVLPLLVAVLLNSIVRGSVFFRTLYFMPVVVSLVVTGLLWSMILEPNFGVLNQTLRNIGVGGWTQLWLADTHWVLPSLIAVSVWQSFGFYLVIYFAALQTIPHELYEAAAVDGVSSWRVFRRITVPLLRPVTTIVIVLNVITGLKAFDQIWVMTRGGPHDASQTLGTYLYSMAFGVGGGGDVPKLGYAAAIGITILFLTALVSWVFVRRAQGPTLE